MGKIKTGRVVCTVNVSFTASSGKFLDFCCQAINSRQDSKPLARWRRPTGTWRLAVNFIGGSRTYSIYLSDEALTWSENFADDNATISVKLRVATLNTMYICDATSMR